MSDHKQSIVFYFVDIFAPHVLKLVYIKRRVYTIGTFKGHKQWTQL